MEIAPSFILPDNELTVTFVRSSGPGGQNVNKVATAVQLRFDVRNSPSLTEDVKARLVRMAGKRMTSDGVLIIEAKRYHTQEQNRTDAELRLAALIQKALVKPKKRRATKPSASARAKRVETKKRRGAIKRIRQSKPNHDA
ncbi:MAG: ribosome-associated protein [Anaerolineaceae bacterium]|nr:MAG: ribosome-associated protein [Anaerolineaceae bacterium]